MPCHPDLIVSRATIEIFAPPGATAEQVTTLAGRLVRVLQCGAECHVLTGDLGHELRLTVVDITGPTMCGLLESAKGYAAEYWDALAAK